MISIAVIRLIGGIAVISIGLAALYWVADAIGDHREAQVRAKIDAAIAVTNSATDAANTTDEETMELAEKIRVAALAAAKKLPVTGQCKLTADEAPVLSRIR